MKHIFTLLLLTLLTMPGWGQETSEEWVDTGVDLGMQGKYDEAIKAYDEVIQINPNLPAAWINKGTAFNNQSKYNEAIKAYDEAIQINPNLVEAWINKGGALNNQGK